MEDGAFILAVQANSEQAAALEAALAESVRAQFQIADSKETALSIVDLQIPDVILLDALLPPPDEDSLLAYVRALADAGHVQVIGLPYLQLEDSSNRIVTRRSFFRRTKVQPRPIPASETVRLFAADVSRYIDRARQIRRRSYEQSRENALAAERRGDQRWSALNVPWLSSVRIAGGANADLINISSRGALVRTRVRPVPISQRHVDLLDLRHEPGLTFHLASGTEVRVDGRVIRCKVKSAETGTLFYDVAFRFDESAGLELPIPDRASTHIPDQFALTTVLHHQIDIPWTEFATP